MFRQTEPPLSSRVDHCTAECVGIHAARRGTRFEALEPLRQGVRQHFDGYREGIAAPGLALRHDHGSQYMSDHFQTELRFLGIATSARPSSASPRATGAPSASSAPSRELLWIERFRTVEALRLALLDFHRTYNESWLIERHGHRSPAQFRRDRMDAMPLAAQTQSSVLSYDEVALSL